VLGQRALRRACGQRGVRRLAKSHEEGVAQLLEQPRRALNVREEKGDSPARELGHPRVQFTTVAVAALDSPTSS